MAVNVEPFLILMIVVGIVCLAVYLGASYDEHVKRQRRLERNVPARRESYYAPSQAEATYYNPEYDYKYVIRRINAETEILVAEERRIRAQINYEMAVHDLNEVRTLTHQRARLR